MRCDPPAHLNQLSQPDISFSSPGHSATINMSRKKDSKKATEKEPKDENKTLDADGQMLIILQALLNVVSMICSLIGAYITFAGVETVIKINKYVDLPSGMTGAAPFLVIGFGACMAIVNAYAFYCVTRKGPIFFISYAIFLMCVGMTMGGLQISLESYREALKEGIADGLKRNIQNYNSVTTNLDMIQSTYLNWTNSLEDIANTTIRVTEKSAYKLPGLEIWNIASFQCCGIENSKDWLQYSPKSMIPKSCCVNPTYCDKHYDKGCDAALNIFICDKVEKLNSLLGSFIWHPAFGIAPALKILTYNVRGKICSDP